MRRKLFFLLEKLEIKRSERIAVSVLLILLVTLSGVLTFVDSEANYSEDEYRKLEEIFREKSKAIQTEEELILARYKPNRVVPVAVSVMENSEPNIIVPDTTADETSSGVSGDLININAANAEKLQELPGIGPAYAGRIVSWREENGAFTSKDQLLEIKGIGEKRLARIKPLITLQ